MRRAVDTNVLVYAHVPSLEHHAAAYALLSSQLGDEGVTLVVTPMILHELVHVLSDPRRFEPSIGMSEATDLALAWLGRSNVECLPVDEQSTALALRLLAHHRLGRRRLADTLLVATLLTHGVRELLSFNSADFAVFEELTVIDPRRRN